MVDLDFVCSEQWNNFCYHQYKESNLPDFSLIGNFKFNLTEIDRAKTENFFNDKHGYSKPKTVASEMSLLDVYKYDQQDKLTLTIKKLLDLTVVNVSLQIQQPGYVIPVHVDRNRTVLGKLSTEEDRKYMDYSDIRRYIYFLEDQKIGQFFQVGKSPLTWVAGDLIEFPYFIPHATANASNRARPILTIDGIKLS